MTVEGASSMSVVIPTLNAGKHLPTLLRSLAVAGLPSGATWVVDGGSSDKTREIAASAGLNIISLSGAPRPPDAKGPSGVMAARNAGVDATATRYVLILDSDMEVSVELVRELVSMAEMNIPAVFIPETTVGETYLARTRRWDRQGRFPRGLNESPRFIQRKVFEMVGPYRTDMSGFDDLEFASRLREAGIETGRTAAPLLHHEEALTWREYLRKRARYAQGLYRLRQLHPRFSSDIFSVRTQAEALIQTFVREPAPRYLAGAIAIRSVEGLLALRSVLERDRVTEPDSGAARTRP